MRRRLFGVVALAAFGWSCQPQSSGPGIVTPGGSAERVVAEPQGPHEGDGRDELVRRQAELRAQLGQISAAASSDPAACETLCALATSICGVAEKLCNLADDHPQDDSYQDLCRQGRLECRESQDSCVRCVEGHGEASGAARPGP